MCSFSLTPSLKHNVILSIHCWWLRSPTSYSWLNSENSLKIASNLPLIDSFLLHLPNFDNIHFEYFRPVFLVKTIFVSNRTLLYHVNFTTYKSTLMVTIFCANCAVVIFCIRSRHFVLMCLFIDQYLCYVHALWCTFRCPEKDTRKL